MYIMFVIQFPSRGANSIKKTYYLKNFDQNINFTVADFENVLEKHKNKYLFKLSDPLFAGGRYHHKRKLY